LIVISFWQPFPLWSSGSRFEINASDLVKIDEREKKLEEEASRASGNADKKELVEDGRMWPYVVPVDAFAEHVFGEYTDKLVEGVVVEYVMKEYDEFMDHNVKGMWLAKIVKVRAKNSIRAECVEGSVPVALSHFKI
ncbi:hypothetical protein TELCIR_10799, partial [Teladorsagia circumcincta]